MDTGVLRGFASAARVGLLAGVASRVGVVLDAGSEARAVAPELVAGLEREVAAAGGGDVGRQVVVDRVAYTWFNRITALRFMDAAGITTMKVVSPVPGGVQPEVLTAAKQGVFEEAVPARDRERVTGYLTGVLASPNPDRDAYGVLLAACCRWWNQAMPFLFEKTADYTELLIPQDLLADDSVRDKAVKILTAEVCEDVEVIGWLYQFYISDRKDEVFAGFKKGKKAGAAEIPAATQLFTPHWIVRYLVENSLGRLWLLNHPDSGLRDQMEYYIDPVDEETDYLRIASPEEIKIIDPACGSGHMLTYAFDLLYAIYEEEGYPPSDIPTLILTKNLFGTEIDERAGALAAFALTMKARLKQKTFLTKKVTPNIRVLRNVVFTPDELNQLRHPTHDRADEDQFWNLFEHADTFGSLVIPNETVLATAQAIIDALPEDDLLSNDLKARARTVVDQAVYLSQRYHAVIANPPYMGTRNMSERLRLFAEERFTKSSGDLCTMFLERSIALVPMSGLASLVVSESWLFTSTFMELRPEIALRGRPIVTACIDKSAFGVRVNVAATVLHRGSATTRSQFFRVRKDAITSGVLNLPPAAEAIFEVDVSTFQRVPGGAFIFDMPSPLRDIYGEVPTVGDVFAVKQGLATADNDRFVRRWWEVSRGRIAFGMSDTRTAELSGRRWFPYNKGGTPVPWWGNQDFVVNWEGDGKEIRAFGTEQGGRARSRAQNTDYYFRPSVTWSNIGSGGARFRFCPEGQVFDIAGMSAFASTDDERLNLLGYLNTRIVRQGLDVLAPTLNYQVGDVARLPLLTDGHDQERVAELIRLSRAGWRNGESAHEFARSPVVAVSNRVLESAVEAVSTADRERDTTIVSLEIMSDRYWTSRIEVASGATIPSSPLTPKIPERMVSADYLADLSSYAVGCMVGRFSIDEPGLILADQGVTPETFVALIPDARFLPDEDNVIPIVDGDWFEDDIVARFREWLKVAFGAEHLQENWNYIEETLGKSIRQYFVKDFYGDHVKRYGTRPIYWLFSSPKGTFNALIYLHRYTPSTAGTVLHDYVLPFLTKLETELGQQEHLTVSADTPRAKAAATKQVETLRKQIVEVRDWATNTLQPLADKQLVIDLDDGVKHNYPRLGKALKKIPGLDTTNE
ncbi:BREX-1 system adenine-specific DNA-methyltransferase PglX (plasmid) [Coraliomargarita sp. W4R53]